MQVPPTCEDLGDNVVQSKTEPSHEYTQDKDEHPINDVGQDVSLKVLPCSWGGAKILFRLFIQQTPEEVSTQLHVHYNTRYFHAPGGEGQ